MKKLKFKADAEFKKFGDLINRCIGRLLSLYKNLSIRTKLMVVLNIVILIPLVTISMVSLKNSEEVLKEKSSQYSQDILKIINLRVDDYISRLESDSTELLTDSLVQKFTKYDRNSVNDSEYYTDRDNIKTKFKNTIRAKEEMQAIAVYSSDLNCFADKSNQAISINSVVTAGSEQYSSMEQLARRNQGAPAFYLYRDGKKKYLFYVRAILDADTYKISGMLVIMINPDWFSSVFNGLVNDDMRQAAILSPNKQVIVSHNGAENYNITNEMFAKINANDSSLFVDNKTKTLISCVTNNQTDWKIATYIPLSVLYSDVQYVKQRILISLVFAVAFLLLISFYISYDFIYSINKLVIGMHKLQEGDGNVSVELNRKDELGFMADNFNTMVKKITTLQKWVIREKLTRKDAQIRALQSQINPHFLFNTLETINWVAQLNNVPEISDTVTALASLMEASIARDGKFITINDEISYIDNFILILKQRFSDKLELVKDVDESVLEVKIPRLLIQPLIENAANHGVANIRGKGIVKLSVKSVESKENTDCISVEIEDNGAGIPEDELVMLNERLSMNDEEYFTENEKKKKTGIGIENVNRRIKLFYGEQYGLKIQSKEGSFTKINFTIPIEAKHGTEKSKNTENTVELIKD